MNHMASFSQRLKCSFRSRALVRLQESDYERLALTVSLTATRVGAARR
jgi:hypothetical protein